MPTTKGDARKGASKGARLAFDATKDTHKKLASKTTLAKKTTTKGGARKTAPVGSRLAYDDTKKDKKKTGGGLTQWRAAVKKANTKLGTSGIPRKGSKAYTEAKKIYGK
jgi:hypothetical protein